MSNAFADFIDQSVIDEVEVTGGYGQNEDGVYAAIVDDVYTREGTENFPDRKWIIIDYSLDNGTQENEWFQLPEEAGNPTDAERTKLSFLIRRLGDLGIDRSRISTFDPTEVIGLRVAVTLRSSRGKGKNSGNVYQNVSKVNVLPADTGAAAEAPAPAVAQPARAAGGTRRPNPAARR